MEICSGIFAFFIFYTNFMNEIIDYFNLCCIILCVAITEMDYYELGGCLEEDN